MSCVLFHMSGVTCQVSGVMCHIFFGQSGGARCWRFCYQRGLPRLVNRPAVAGALLQTASSLIDFKWLTEWSFSSQSSRYHKSLTLRARELDFLENVHPPQYATCHLSLVTCHVSHARCHMLCVTSEVAGVSGGASWWRVCYQWGLPCLVF